MMKLFITALLAALTAISFSACTTDIYVPEPPELIRSPAATIDTATIGYGNLIDKSRRSGITRYLSTPLYYASPISSFYQFHVSMGEAVVAGQLLVSLDTTAIDLEIETLETRLHTMGQNHQRANEILSLDIRIMEADGDHVNAAQAQMRLRHQQERQALETTQTATRLSDLQTRRERALLHAPFDGEITNMLNINPGQWPATHQPIIFITDKSEVIIEAINLPASDWPAGGPGGNPPDPWRPNLLRRAISMYANIDDRPQPLEYLPVSLQERDIRPVRFVLADETDIMPPAGQYVPLYFYTTFVPDVLLVPDNAIFFAGSQPYVYRIVNGDMVYTEIMFAGRTSVMSAVSQGLSAGDVVFIR